MAQLIKDRSPRTLGYGKRPDERTVDELLQAGVINLDKVQGPTSHQVTAWVKDILGVKRIGHGGTLDPQVSGVLPIALGRGVRLTDLVLRSDKQYVCHLKLHRDRQRQRVEEVIKTFIGDIYQTPPVRAAVKRQMRVRRVHSINILEIEGRDALFKVDCDAGTYIRTLCVDIGDALGAGANMESLRRTRSGSMTEDTSVKVQDLKDAMVMYKEGTDRDWLRTMIRPLEVLVGPIPKTVVKDGAVDAICHGANLAAPGVISIDETLTKGSLTALMSQKGECIALGVTLMSAQDMLKADEGLVVRTDRVLMPTGVYPSIWGKEGAQ